MSRPRSWSSTPSHSIDKGIRHARRGAVARRPIPSGIVVPPRRLRANTRALCAGAAAFYGRSWLPQDNPAPLARFPRLIDKSLVDRTPAPARWRAAGYRVGVQGNHEGGGATCAPVCAASRHLRAVLVATGGTTKPPACRSRRLIYAREKTCGCSCSTLLHAPDREGKCNYMKTQVLNCCFIAKVSLGNYVSL